MFELTDHPIDSAALRARLTRPDAGACVVFEGWVRNHHLGQPVRELHYEAFDVMAKLEGNSIIAEIEQRFPGCAVFCVHRTGALCVGELAVWIGVASAHRAVAFQACRHAIEEIKRRLPIWKKEFHPDGASEWVNCSAEAMARGPQPTDYYARQAGLPEIGEAGQEKLAQARVLIVGVGGLGCPAALYLAGAGVGQLTMVDSGKVELSNLHRQILFTTDDLGTSKADAAVAALRARNPFVQFEAVNAEFTAQNARALVAGRTVVLDCTDNFATRFVLHDACFSAGVPLVQAAVHRFEGTLDVFHRGGGGGCLHCLRQNRGIAELDTAAGNCAGGAVFGPAVGVLGTMQAGEALKILVGQTDAGSFRKTHLINLLDCSLLSVTREADPGCPVCGELDAMMPAVLSSEATGGSVTLDTEQMIALENVRTVALLAPGEQLDSARAAAGTLTAAIGDLARLRELIREEGNIILTCRHGIRSAALARLLRTEGCGTVYASAIGSPAIVSKSD
ncbi:MAG TPA: ThiF family adenylyltransferase [Lacunisphaera sp.]|jgi:adenylyltransferase/sulfurtransferase